MIAHNHINAHSGPARVCNINRLGMATLLLKKSFAFFEAIAIVMASAAAVASSSKKHWLLPSLWVNRIVWKFASSRPWAISG